MCLANQQARCFVNNWWADVEGEGKRLDYLHRPGAQPQVSGRIVPLIFKSTYLYMRVIREGEDDLTVEVVVIAASLFGPGFMCFMMLS